jgi:hypothetical protein
MSPVTTATGLRARPQPSSTSTARCSGAPAVRGVLRGDARRRARAERSVPGERCCTGCSTRSARTAVDGARPPGARFAAGQVPAPTSRPPPSGRRRLVRDGAALRPARSRAPRRRAADRARHHHAVRPGEAVRRPARPRRRRRHPLRRHADGTTTAPSTALRVGPASSPPSRVGRGQRGRPRARATPTPTASTTRRCSRPSASVVVNPDPRMVLWPRCGAGRCSTSTCRPGCPSCPVGIEPSRSACSSPVPSWCPYARFDIDGHREHPGRGPAILVRQPPRTSTWPWR